jgi:PAS domain S-box-containing protein
MMATSVYVMQLSSHQEIQILYVDDDPFVTDLTGMCLEREDDRFAVEIATRADEGLQHVNYRLPDCVVSDYDMPGMDGIEFLQAVRAEYPHLPFILYTAKGNEAVASEAITADVTSYLQKQSGTEHYELLAKRIKNAVQSRRKTERAERRKRERQEYETIIKALSDAVYVVDEDGRFRSVNDEFTELVGYSKETIIGSTMSLIKDGNSVERAEHHLGRVLSSDGPETVTFEVTIQPRTGDPTVCEDHMSVLPYDGEEFNGSVGVLRDITERKQYEQQLEAQNERLEEFIVSHDIRNPLSVAGGYLELARGSDEGISLAKAADAIERSQALIDDLLTLAREGGQADEIKPVDLTQVAKESWQTTETAQATLNVDESEIIEADPSRLQELFENLYRNAVEHGNDDVTVRVNGMEDGFYVADTGSGIPESARDEIFEPGYSTADDGTGLGMRIVEEIAKTHGWEVSVTESKEGGARIDITGAQKMSD